jgi:hypothetical protein
MAKSMGPELERKYAEVGKARSSTDYKVDGNMNHTLEILGERVMQRETGSTPNDQPLGQGLHDWGYDQVLPGGERLSVKTRKESGFPVDYAETEKTTRLGAESLSWDVCCLLVWNGGPTIDFVGWHNDRSVLRKLPFGRGSERLQIKRGDLLPPETFPYFIATQPVQMRHVCCRCEEWVYLDDNQFYCCLCRP